MFEAGWKAISRNKIYRLLLMGNVRYLLLPDMALLLLLKIICQLLVVALGAV